jgi:hypothetical protein
LYFAFADEERIQEKFSCGCESKNKEEMKVSFCVGIDIAKDKFDVCIKEQKSDGRSVVKGSRSFSNAEAGFEELGGLDWETYAGGFNFAVCDGSYGCLLRKFGLLA